MRDTAGGRYTPDPARIDNIHRPISSIARDVSTRNDKVSAFGKSIPQVERPGSIKAWYGDTVSPYLADSTPTRRPYGKEGTDQYPDWRARSATEGVKEASRVGSKMQGQGRRQGLTPQELRTYTGPLNQVASGLREDARRYEQEYTNNYVSHQTKRMRDMMDARKPKTETPTAPSDMHRNGTAPAKPPARSGRFDGPASASDHLDVDSGIRRVNSRGESISSAASNMDKYQKSRKGIAGENSNRRETAGVIAGALTVPMAYGLKALYDDRRQQTIDNNVNRRRDDASDMGPVKGRALERSNQFEGGRPKTMADLNQEKDVNTMKKNGTSLTKALLKDAKK
jgi:hypothetical protein